MKIQSQKSRALLIPVLLLVLVVVVYSQYGADAPATRETRNEPHGQKLAKAANDGSGSESRAEATESINFDTTSDLDPFARRGAIASLYSLPKLAPKSTATPKSPKLVSSPNPLLQLPPDSLQAVFKTSGGWSAIVDSRVLKEGDVLYSRANIPYASVAQINEQGVLLHRLNATPSIE